jgi:site-specific DNA-methyltransferase (adenine-specific)
MLQDRRIAALVDHPQLYDCFPGVKIRGGVSYFHWRRDHDGPCAVTTKIGAEVVGQPMTRELGAYDVFIRSNQAIGILDKVAAYRVKNKPEPSLSLRVSVRRPFGIDSKHIGSANSTGLKEPVRLFGKHQQESWIERASVPAGREWIDDWKVLLVKAHGTSGREDKTILGEPVVAPPGSVCTESYLIVGRYDDESHAGMAAVYMRTRFVRLLVATRKTTHNITRDSYRFGPDLPVDRAWTDAALYARYGLDDDQIAYIEGRISTNRPRWLESSTTRPSGAVSGPLAARR